MIELLVVNLGRHIKELTDKRWGAITPAAPLSMQYAVTEVDGGIYLFGGRVGVSLTARGGAYKYQGGIVTPLAGVPQALAAGCAAAVGRKIYLFGGCAALANGYENKKVYVYDIDSNTYTTGTDMPVNCVVGSCVAIGTDIYVYGGMNSQNEVSFPKLFYKYDTIDKTWESLPYHDGPALYSTACVEFNGQLVAFGGEYNNASGNDVNVRVYDPATNTWSTLPVNGNKPGVRGAVAMIKYDEHRFIVIGGRVGGLSTCTSEVWVFDMDTLQWTILNPLPSPLAFHGGGLIDGETVVVFDGYTGVNAVNVTYTLT